MGVRRPYNQWKKRFDDNLSPRKDNRGFDGIPDGAGAGYAARMKERWDCLASRIARHGGLTTSSFTPSSGSTYQPTLPPFWLTWNKNPQCPPDEWKKMSVSFVPKNKKTFKGLAVQRHSEVKSTLDNINHIELSFSINNDIDLGYGFWLIDDQYKDFVYAILKSSMFRAWCELTANTKWVDGAGHSHQGDGHFTVGMWDTFPLPYLSPCNEKFIIGAAKDKNWDQLNVLIDKLFVPGISNPLQDSCRLQILAEGFLDAFY